MTGVLFWIIGVRVDGEYYRLATATTPENARKLARFAQAVINVTEGKGQIETTEVKE